MRFSRSYICKPSPIEWLTRFSQSIECPSWIDQWANICRDGLYRRGLLWPFEGVSISICTTLTLACSLNSISIRLNEMFLSSAMSLCKWIIWSVWPLKQCVHARAYAYVYMCVCLCACLCVCVQRSTFQFKFLTDLRRIEMFPDVIYR